jgi:hypothetical protein
MRRDITHRPADSGQLLLGVVTEKPGILPSESFVCAANPRPAA